MEVRKTLTEAVRGKHFAKKEWRALAFGVSCKCHKIYCQYVVSGAPLFKWIFQLQKQSLWLSSSLNGECFALCF